MELKIAICDDIRIHREKIEKITHSIIDNMLGGEFYNNSVVSYYEFPSAENVIRSIRQERKQYDLLISDIQMSENSLSGIDLAKEVNRLLPDCKIIFVTAYNDYAMDVYETEHTYLVFKNRLEEGLPVALEKAIMSIFNDFDSKIAINQSDGLIMVKTKEIIYLEREGRNTKVVADSDVYLSKQNLNEIEKMLPPSKFVKCHNSFIINLDRVKIYRSGSLITEDDKEISISRKYKDSFNDSFFMNIVSKSLRGGNE